MFNALIRLMKQHHVRHGGDTWVITVNPKHRNFYTKVLGFVPDRKDGHEVDAVGIAAMIYSNRGVALAGEKPSKRLEAARCCLAALALDPMVLISRPISCARKSSVRPTGSLAFRQSRN